METLISINGEICHKDQGKISVFDRGFLYGDSVYEVTQTFSRAIFMLDEHLERLWQSAIKMDMLIDFSKELVTKNIKDLLEKINKENVYLRIIITRGEGEIGLATTLATKNNLIIMAIEKSPNPRWWYESGVTMIIAEIKRNSKNALDPEIKSGNYLNNVLAMNEATKANVFDAIMLNSDNHITEATTSNIWIIKDQTLYTPPLSAGILGGLTRLSLIKLARQKNLKVVEENFDVTALKAADECFLTSTTKMIVPIVCIDQSKIGPGTPGKLTIQLLNWYKEENKI